MAIYDESIWYQRFLCFFIFWYKTCDVSITVLPVFINGCIFNNNFSEIEKVEASARLNFFQAWKPYSARRYEIGDQQIVVYSLGWGQKKGYNKSSDQFWTPNNKTIEEVIEGKDVMMHGQRFDFLQWL